jgi:glutamine amidotransferase
MSERDVLVVRTGTANLASVLAGLERAGARASVTADPFAVRDAGRLVLPGVGAFAAAMHELESARLVEALATRLREARPTLAVCLGMQLLGEESEESPGVRGLALFPGRALRFPGSVRTPQLGWNRIEPSPECRLLRSGHAYFANSYRFVTPPAGWHAALCDHGGPFVAAIERGSILACQFHPELSGGFGRELIERWLNAGDRVGGERC